MDRIAEAGDDGPLAARKSSVPDKQSFCVDILMHGYVQSFVDFFYLTHRPDPVAGAWPLFAVAACLHVANHARGSGHPRRSTGGDQRFCGGYGLYAHQSHAG